MEQKLVHVERGNVVLKVPEDAVQHYMDQGYSVVDNKGNVIKASIPRDLGTLQKAFVEKSAEIEQLKAEIEQLKAEIARPKKPKKQTTTNKKEVSE